MFFPRYLVQIVSPRLMSWALVSGFPPPPFPQPVAKRAAAATAGNVHLTRVTLSPPADRRCRARRGIAASHESIASRGARLPETGGRRQSRRRLSQRGTRWFPVWDPLLSTFEQRCDHVRSLRGHSQPVTRRRGSSRGNQRFPLEEATGWLCQTVAVSSGGPRRARGRVHRDLRGAQAAPSALAEERPWRARSTPRAGRAARPRAWRRA